MPAPVGPLGHSEAVWKEKLTEDTGKNMTTSAGLGNPLRGCLRGCLDNDGLEALLAVVGLLIVGWALLMLCYRWVCRRGHGTTESSGASGPAKIPKISGLTAAALQSLGSSVVGTAPADAENSGVWVPMDPSDSCCVCLSEFCKAETVRTLRCGHTFHQQCIDEWLTKQAVCPLCKSAVTVVIEVAHESSSQTFQCGTCRLWWASQPTLATEWTDMRLDHHSHLWHDGALAEGASP